jgi:2-polyprenyl-6-methoxyphenol hydroxylase-like FAD-dependent oxidoreductase
MPHVIVVGAGPAGASLAFLLADRGAEVTLVERQRDFAREFRGEVVLPSGRDALEQMGLADAVAKVPQWSPTAGTIYLNRRPVVDLVADPELFGGRPPLAVSQPALLEAIVAEAAKRPSFAFLRGASVRDLVREGGRVAGVRLATDAGERELRADLVVGADGRASAVRRRGGFGARETALPMDVVWTKLPAFGEFRGVRAYVGRGHLLIAYHTFDDRLQVAWAILKGTFGELRRRGVSQWVEDMANHVTPDLASHLRASAGALASPFLLDVVADHATRWSAPGALLIGDAAHTMSPVGGQGINVALRDAIVAANHLVPPLRAGAPGDALDAAAHRVEQERRPEIEEVQRLAALPPRVVLARAWWGEPLRGAIGLLLRSGFGRRLAASRVAGVFAFGVTEVRLRV